MALADKSEGTVRSATSGAEDSATAIGAIKSLNAGVVATGGLAAGETNVGISVETGGSATGYL